MKDIFSDLYDKVLSFFTSSHEEETKLLAKNRLKSVLMQDRVGFSERAMQMLKDDMISVISQYLEINTENFDLSLDADENATILNFSIPVLRPKTDEEIDEALALAQKAKIEKTHEIVGELQELVKEKAQELAMEMNCEEAQDKSELDLDANTSNNPQEETEKSSQQQASQEEKANQNSKSKDSSKQHS